MRRGGCLELYYCNMVEWFWWDSSLIFDDELVSFSALTLWFGQLACKNCPEMTYNVLSGTLNLTHSQSDLLTSVADISTRSSLRASSSGNHFLPRTERRFGDRASSVAAPPAWNRLTTKLKLMRSTTTFKRHLKTFLFNSA